MVNKDFREAGTVRDHYGDDLAVSVSPDGDVLLVITMNDEDEPRSLSVVFAPAARDEVRELLGRAAGDAREKLAAAIEAVRRAHSETEESYRAQGRYMVSADQLAGELLAALGRAAMPGQVSG